MRTSSTPSYSAQVLTAPPRRMTFSTGSDPSAALLAARYWVEDQARSFLVEHSLPRNPWEAGIISAAGPDQGSTGRPLAGLVIYTSDGDYVFGWDDQG